MSRPAVEVQVGELLIDGYADPEGERVLAAVQAELAARLAGATPGTPSDAAAQTAEAAVAAAIRAQP